MTRGHARLRGFAHPTKRACSSPASGRFPARRRIRRSALMRTLAGEPPERFGASALRAVVLPTDYRRSWETATKRSNRAPRVSEGGGDGSSPMMRSRAPGGVAALSISVSKGVLRTLRQGFRVHRNTDGLGGSAASPERKRPYRDLRLGRSGRNRVRPLPAAARSDRGGASAPGWKPRARRSRRAAEGREAPTPRLTSAARERCQRGKQFQVPLPAGRG